MRERRYEFMKRNIAVIAVFSCLSALLSTVQPASGVSCTPQSELGSAERDGMVAAAKRLGLLVEAGNVDGVRAITAPSVLAQFAGIAVGIRNVAPLTSGAALTVVNLYGLDASDLTSADEQTQFFCGGLPTSEVVFSIPQIPPGKYALAVLHATGVVQPQQISFILQATPPPAPAATPQPENPAQPGIAAPPNAPPSASPQTAPIPAAADTWKLAGMFVRPLTWGGQDGLWYWTRARAFAKSKQNWNAYFYYQTAETLLVPVDFMSSPNLERLIKEQTSVAPPALPAAQPMTLSFHGKTYPVTALNTEGSLGGLDLVITYQAPDNSDPVAARTRNIEVMQAMLSQHPELREAFHGIWVYSNATSQQPFANELPMGQIP